MGATATEPSPVAIDPTGQFAYVGDVVSNTVVMSTIDPQTGLLTTTGTVPTGSYPFSLAIDISGKFVYAANQNSFNISEYSIDPKTGNLTSIGTIAAGNQPVSLITTGKIQ
jgi:YVTN family beta-propeller protein